MFEIGDSLCCHVNNDVNFNNNFDLLVQKVLSSIHNKNNNIVIVTRVTF